MIRVYWIKRCNWRTRSNSKFSDYGLARFEYLVQNCLKIFGGEGEVKVTQASRRSRRRCSFDPDPIRGGKIVIQAKRYNVVGVQGSWFICNDDEWTRRKGIVTTSYFMLILGILKITHSIDWYMWIFLALLNSMVMESLILRKRPIR